MSDTLVLKIVEKCQKDGKIDTTMYILYDVVKKCYIVRGTRPNGSHNDPLYYSFKCKKTKHLSSFIHFVIDCNNPSSYILYNYDNLPATSDEITYEFLDTYDDTNYEIVGYDDVTVSHKLTKRILRIVKNVFNPY